VAQNLRGHCRGNYLAARDAGNFFNTSGRAADDRFLDRALHEE